MRKSYLLYLHKNPLKTIKLYFNILGFDLSFILSRIHFWN